MPNPVDLQPAAERLARLVRGVPDDALRRATPCERYSVGDLLDHIGGFAASFIATAVKRPLLSAPSGDAARLRADWRTHIPADLQSLARAWSDPDAWTGVTQAGGVELPGEVAGMVALGELVIHGWDLAVATGQPSKYDGPGLDALLATVAQFQNAGIDGIFGPAVTITDDATQLERVVALAGRDPAWRPPARSTGA